MFSFPPMFLIELQQTNKNKFENYRNRHCVNFHVFHNCQVNYEKNQKKKKNYLSNTPWQNSKAKLSKIKFSYTIFIGTRFLIENMFTYTKINRNTFTVKPINFWLSGCAHNPIGTYVIIDVFYYARIVWPSSSCTTVYYIYIYTRGLL